MNTNLQTFREQGTEFQKVLTNMALYMCYLSSKYGFPFCVQYIIDERDDYRYDYLDGFLHGICLIQNSPIVCSKYIEVTGLGKSIDWYLCKSFTYDINLINQTLEEVQIKKLEEQIKGVQPQLQTNNFSYANGININQTSLNDDICLYALLHANNNRIAVIPMKVLENTTPCYSTVQALGILEGLRVSLNDDFNCTLDIEKNVITINKISTEYLKIFNRTNLLSKYTNQNMYIEGLLDCIEFQCKTLTI